MYLHYFMNMYNYLNFKVDKTTASCVVKHDDNYTQECKSTYYP